LVRLRGTSVPGFPRCGSATACHAKRPTPPSSNRTCRFPASGSPASSRFRHSQKLQIHQSHLLQVRIQRHTFWRLEWSLTASVQVDCETVPHICIDLSVCQAGIAKREVVCPAGQMQIEFINHPGQWLETHPCPGHLSQALPLSRQRLLGSCHIQILLRFPSQVSIISERVPQEVQARPFFFQVHYSRLFPVDLQPHPAFQLRFDEPYQFFSWVACHHHEIIRISHQPGFRPGSRSALEVKHLVKPVQVDIRQQG
jgi:hypothetical protein